MATEKFFVFNEDGALKRLKGRIVRYLDNEDPTGSDKSAIRTSLEVSPDAAGLVQADVGTAPNEIPVNGMLGDMAYQSSDGVSMVNAEVETLEVTGQVTGTLNIATASPEAIADADADDLVIGDGLLTNFGATIATNSSGQAKINFADGAGANAARGQIKYDHQFDKLSVSTAGAERVVVDEYGRTGIGAASPSSTLDIEVGGANGAEISLNQTGTNGRDFRIGSTGTGYGSAGNLIFYDATAGAERWRIDSSGNLVANGTAIDFGSTSSGSGNTVTSGLLDDYEEGDWTPSPTSGSITGTGLTYVGKYTKIGRMVQIYIRVNATAQDINVSSYVGFTGVPFSISTKASGTVIGEDIDQVAQQGFAALSSNTLFFGACGNSTAIGLTATLTGYI